MYWYRSQTTLVIWGESLSDPFSVCNGVKQGGILSPQFFNVYMNDPSITLNNTNIGGQVGKPSMLF